MFANKYRFMCNTITAVWPQHSTIANSAATRMLWTEWPAFVNAYTPVATPAIFFSFSASWTNFNTADLLTKAVSRQVVNTLLMKFLGYELEIPGESSDDAKAWQAWERNLRTFTERMEQWKLWGAAVTQLSSRWLRLTEINPPSRCRFEGGS